MSQKNLHMLTKSDSFIADFGKRFSALLKDKEVNIKKLADELQLSRSAIYDWKEGKSLPSIAKAAALARALNASLDDLFDTQGLTGGEFIFAPILDLRLLPMPLAELRSRPARGGGGLRRIDFMTDVLAFAQEQQPGQPGTFPLQKEAARHMLPEVTDLDALALVVASGVSMAPTIEEGDLLIVNRADVTPRSDAACIFVVRFMLEVGIKRLLQLRKATAVISDNKLFETFEVLPGDKEFKVLGKALWIAKRATGDVPPLTK